MLPCLCTILCWSNAADVTWRGQQLLRLKKSNGREAGRTRQCLCVHAISLAFCLFQWALLWVHKTLLTPVLDELLKIYHAGSFFSSFSLQLFGVWLVQDAGWPVNRKAEKIVRSVSGALWWKRFVTFLHFCISFSSPFLLFVFSVCDLLMWNSWGVSVKWSTSSQSLPRQIRSPLKRGTSLRRR